MTTLPVPPDYSFLATAAAEARAESRRYWAKGGYADKKYPQHPIKGWKIPLVDDPGKRLEQSLKRHRK